MMMMIFGSGINKRKSDTIQVVVVVPGGDAVMMRYLSGWQAEYFTLFVVVVLEKVTSLCRTCPGESKNMPKFLVQRFWHGEGKTN